MKENFTKFPLQLLKMGSLHPKYPYTLLDKIKLILTLTSTITLLITALVGIFREKNIKFTIRYVESFVGFSQVTKYYLKYFYFKF